MHGLLTPDGIFQLFASLCIRLPLFFITGPRFKRKLDEYLRARLRKGPGRVVGASKRRKHHGGVFLAWHTRFF